MSVRLANLHDPHDAHWVVALLDMYCCDAFGDGEPLSAKARENLIPGLIKHGGARVFLAFAKAQAEPLGIAICMIGFSSFRGGPLLNIHDLAVSPAARGQGIGTALLQAVEDEARALGCCRITLEVRSDNTRAKKLYQQVGFEADQPETWFWKKHL
jgi:ribosomal protein S18 acetylase RimI-like enzyme